MMNRLMVEKPKADDDDQSVALKNKAWLCVTRLHKPHNQEMTEAGYKRQGYVGRAHEDVSSPSR